MTRHTLFVHPFVGATLTGPVGGTPELLTSFADFERIYGGVDDLAFGSDAMLNRNYLAHAGNAYFNNGGARLYVVRTFIGTIASATATGQGSPVLSANSPATVWFTALFPGSCFCNGKVTLQNVATPIGAAGMANAPDGSVVRVHVPVVAAPPPAPRARAGTRSCTGPRAEPRTGTEFTGRGAVGQGRGRLEEACQQRPGGSAPGRDRRAGRGLSDHAEPGLPAHRWASGRVRRGL